LTVLGNVLAVWNREQLGLELQSGMDEVALALVADAWSRTYRSRAVTFAASALSQETRNGIRIIPDRVAPTWSGGSLISTIENRRPVEALDDTLRAIANRYGAPTANVVAMQLEYPSNIPK
jgi:hypothetical protein